MVLSLKCNISDVIEFELIEDFGGCGEVEDSVRFVV